MRYNSVIKTEKLLVQQYNEKVKEYNKNASALFNSLKDLSGLTINVKVQNSKTGMSFERLSTIEKLDPNSKVKPFLTIKYDGGVVNFGPPVGISANYETQIIIIEKMDELDEPTAYSIEEWEKAATRTLIRKIPSPTSKEIKPTPTISPYKPPLVPSY